MGDKTGIEWTDATWNPVTGCTKVSQGCKNCYAETVADRFWPTQYPPIVQADGSERPRRFTDVQWHEDRLDQPLRWKRPRRIFVNSMSDLFHEDVPDWVIVKVFAVMAAARQHRFQVLTKRPSRMRRFLDFLTQGFKGRGAGGSRLAPAGEEDDGTDRLVREWEWPLPNVWLGVSVEDQKTADERIPLLLDTQASVRWLSMEPLLDDVTIRPWLYAKMVRPGVMNGRAYQQSHDDNQIDWVVVGGESGPGARPMRPDWARSLRDQCQAADVAFFFKQMGGRGPKALWQEIPEDLLIKEYPNASA